MKFLEPFLILLYENEFPNKKKKTYDFQTCSGSLCVKSIIFTRVWHALENSVVNLKPCITYRYYDIDELKDFRILTELV